MTSMLSAFDKAANDGEHILYFIGQTYVSAKCTVATTTTRAGYIYTTKFCDYLTIR